MASNAKKKVKYIPISTISVYVLPNKLVDFIKELTTRLNAVSEDLRDEIVVDFMEEEGSDVVKLGYYIFETDEEYKARIKEEKKLHKANELELLNKLINKYVPGEVDLIDRITNKRKLK